MACIVIQVVEGERYANHAWVAVPAVSWPRLWRERPFTQQQCVKAHKATVEPNVEVSEGNPSPLEVVLVLVTPEALAGSILP